MKLTRHPRLALVTAAALLTAAALAKPVSALYFVKDVNKAEAGKLGITVTIGPSANDDTRVQVTFKTTGPLSNFRFADLNLERNGKRLVSSYLMARKPSTDSPEESRMVDFYIDPAVLPDASVTVVAYPEPLTGYGYRLRMKDYLPKATRR